MIQQQISARLEKAFSMFGFTEPNVAKLRAASGVSLRTLYRYYPSKEAMVIAALQHRHRRYMGLLIPEQAEAGPSAIMTIFKQLETWMSVDAPHGCMSMSALAAYPKNQQIIDAVKQHKQEIQTLLLELSGCEQLALQLFVLHEGVAMSWPIIGKQSTQSAQLTVQQLLGKQR
ncbi:TetR/AcrR family transcriptional regulator [Agarivorans sp. MS3-6]|uniref:TetR/AcrR family transcriptional regulator n=1 Tax=Agarivorans sp. TSD2052 TaxID=2937286 RepID=UPI00200F1AC8|nr:TetR/AcrR family transcriptional regulator [Agarivorans sp. TSD2052]UPW17522.1 TetR/AcrR family transcriptional regulator [Agarivorans sp. TSD2052]